MRLTAFAQKPKKEAAADILSLPTLSRNNKTRKSSVSKRHTAFSSFAKGK